LFQGERVIGEKWEREVKEDKDKDYFVSFLYRKRNEKKNEAEVQKGFNI